MVVQYLGRAFPKVVSTQDSFTRILEKVSLTVGNGWKRRGTPLARMLTYVPHSARMLTYYVLGTR